MRTGPINNGRRSRGRPNRNKQHGGGGGSGGPSRSSTFDSNGPEGRIRGNASQVYEKYLALARDAGSSGDRVAAESYMQHAEHYFRILNDSTDPPGPDVRNNGEARAYGDQQGRQPGQGAEEFEPRQGDGGREAYPLSRGERQMPERQQGERQGHRSSGMGHGSRFSDQSAEAASQPDFPDSPGERRQADRQVERGQERRFDGDQPHHRDPRRPDQPRQEPRFGPRGETAQPDPAPFPGQGTGFAEEERGNRSRRYQRPEEAPQPRIEPPARQEPRLLEAETGAPRQPEVREPGRAPRLHLRHRSDEAQTFHSAPAQPASAPAGQPAPAVLEAFVEGTPSGEPLARTEGNEPNGEAAPKRRGRPRKVQPAGDTTAAPEMPPRAKAPRKRSVKGEATDELPLETPGGE